MNDAQYIKINGKWQLLSKDQLIEKKYQECSEAVWKLINQDGYIGQWAQHTAKRQYHPGLKAFGVCSCAVMSILCGWTLLVATDVIPSMDEAWQVIEYGFKWLVIMAQIASGLACPVEPITII